MRAVPRWRRNAMCRRVTFIIIGQVSLNQPAQRHCYAAARSVRGRGAGRGRFRAPAKLRHARRVRHRAALRSANPAAAAVSPRPRGAADPNASARREGEGPAPGRKTAACRRASPWSSPFSAKRRVSSIQVSVRNHSGRQKQQPRRAGGRGRRLQPCATRPVGDQQPAACHVRDLRGRVMRTGIGDDDFSHRAGRRAGNERGQRRQ